MNKLLLEFNKFKEFDDEEFKFLVYPDVIQYKYVISSYGKLFTFVNMNRKCVFYDKDGYERTSISVIKNGIKKSILVGIHRLVAYTFCTKLEGCDVVNHLDGNKRNNKYTNLEWTTPLGNTRHALRTGLQCNSGPNCPSAVYTENTVRTICQMFEDGYDNFEIYKYITNHECVEDRAVYALIHSIKTGKRHKDISSEYDIPKEVTSKKKPKFSKEDTILINKLILEGKTTSEIVKYFGGQTCHDKIGKRVCDKVRAQRKKLNQR